MNLSEKPDTIQWEPMHYVFVEKIGPFQDTAQAAWQELHAHVAAVAKQCEVLGFMSLYKVEPQMLYRAGVKVSARPASLPPGFSYMKFEGGKYSRFVLVGSYMQLPEACGQAFGFVEKTQMPLRDDFFIENYVNDPKTTPEKDLITEILMPTK